MHHKAKLLLDDLSKNPFVLAPMAGITDVAFRSYMKRLGAGIVTTELVSANGLQHQSEKTYRLMDFTEAQRPVGIQLFGETPEALAFAARQAEEAGADFVDLNFGCPVKKVVSKGAGSAVLRDLGQLSRILSAVQGAISIPLTIKIRTGWEPSTRNALEVAHIAHNEGVTWVAIHGRTRSQGYTGQADWNYISEVAAGSSIPIIGNGDIQTAGQAVDYLRHAGVRGVMIGRGCLRNPWIFKQCQSIVSGGESIGQWDWGGLILQLHAELLSHFDQRVVFIQLRKFAGWYSHGFANSSNFRRALFDIKSLAELLDRIVEFFSQMTDKQTFNYEKEPFLMGGHG